MPVGGFFMSWGTIAGMEWLILTALAIIARAGQSVTVKVQSNKAELSASTRAVLLTGAATVLSLLVSPLIGGINGNGLARLWWAALLMVLSQGFGNVIFFKGMATLDASVTQIAFSVIVIWGGILSVIFLGSHFSTLQYVGVAVMLAAIWLTQYSRKRRKINVGVWWIILSAGLMAVFQVSSAELAKTVSAGTYLVLAFAGSTILVGAIYWNRLVRDWAVVRRKTLTLGGATLMAATTSVLYFAFAYFAYHAAPDRGVVVLLLTGQVVLSVILGIILLKERDGVVRKLAAGCLALLASLLIKS